MALAVLEDLAVRVSERLASGLRDSACTLALNELVPAARNYVDRHRSMTPTVPNALFSSGGTAFAADELDLATPLLLTAARCAVFVEGRSSGQLVLPSNEMFIGALNVVLSLSKELKPLTELDAAGKLRLINSARWPYLRSATETFLGTAEMLSMLYGSGEQGFRLIAVALGMGALDLEPFIRPGDREGELAAQETRFWHATVMSATEPVQYDKVDAALREGITRIIEMDGPRATVDGGSLARALNALKFALFATGNFSPLASLEMSFDGLAQFEQLNLELPDHPATRAAMRARLTLNGPVNGFGVRMRAVYETLVTNERVNLQELIERSLPDEPH
ncbi:MAG: hypothetical protein IRZ08_05505 [Frankia sp.]|nr:hypothetical protein [Frankia sp.]